MKFDVIVADPPWEFSDLIDMDSVPRGAESQYPVLNIEAIKALEVSKIAADDSVLALWVPSSLLREGLDTMVAWGFRQTQTHIWIKVKQEPLKSLKKALKKAIKKNDNIDSVLDSFNFDETLAFGMGRLFRQTHEICLIGVRGKVYNALVNKSQRSVHFDLNKGHSSKPELLQNKLELMFPAASFLEMFGRRSRAGWVVVGNEVSDLSEDIRDSIIRLAAL